MDFSVAWVVPFVGVVKHCGVCMDSLILSRGVMGGAVHWAGAVHRSRTGGIRLNHTIHFVVLIVFFCKLKTQCRLDL
jgi:hypothetical protein